MSAKTNETLAQQEPTAELFSFTYLGGVYRYTSHQKNLVNSVGDLYVAVPIKRTGFQIEGGAGVMRMSITIVFKGTIFESLRNTNNMPIDISITKCLISNIEDNYRVFTGRVMRIQYSRQECIMEVIGGGYELERENPTVYVQEGCNNMLFDSTCALAKGAYEIQARITDINYAWGFDFGFGGVLLLENYTPDSFGNNLNDYRNSYYLGGNIRIGNEYVMIKFCDPVTGPTNFYTHHQLSGNISAGDVVTVLPGCNRLAYTCKNTFDNIDNFVGMPYLPSINPILWGIKEITT